jgi:hypothetical protein
MRLCLAALALAGALFVVPAAAQPVSARDVVDALRYRP